MLLDHPTTVLKILRELGKSRERKKSSLISREKVNKDKDFPSATRSRTEILTKENLVGARTVPTAVSRTFTPLVREARFP